MKKLLISSAVAASLFATVGLAQVATDGTGQFLVAPAYYASQGFETNVKLVNTSRNQSVIMRGVIRDHIASDEIDFIITLSPSDVWEGRIYEGSDGKVYLQSDDISTYKELLKDPINLVQRHLASGKIETDFVKGYVEFYPVRTITHPNEKKVSKREKFGLYEAFENLSTSGTIAPALPGAVEDPVFDNNAVTGYVTLTNTKLKAAMKLPMMAFENVQASPQPSGQTLSVAADTAPDRYIVPATVYSDLQATTVTVPYEGKGVNDGIYFAFWGDYTGQNDPRRIPNWKDCVQQRSYNLASRDMEENRNPLKVSPAPFNSVMCEFNAISVNSILRATESDYEKGMVQVYNLTNIASTTNQAGVPTPSVIATNISATFVNGQPSYSWVYAPVK